MPPTASALSAPFDENIVSPTRQETKEKVVENNNGKIGEDKFLDNVPTVGELRACIPAECFEKSLITSVSYLVWDFFVLACLYKVEPYFELFSLPGMIFWYFLMGMMNFSVFVVGHDCGHGTFSDYTWVNDIFGHISHGIIFAPFWPWQKSHRQHHTYTSHLEKDRGHPWITDEIYQTWTDFQKFYANNPVTSIVRWFFYTILGVTDGSHFNPMSSLFTNTKERIQCVVSGLACLSWAYAAYWFVNYDFYLFVKFYVIPCLSGGFWLTMVTYLQHQTDDIKVFENGTWGYVKGQLQTIDRPYGFGIDELMHHITDGHVAHHLFFTAIPHYNLMKATAALKKKLEPLGVYRKQTSYDFLYQFFSLNMRLRYLTGQGSGLLNYAKTQ